MIVLLYTPEVSAPGSLLKGFIPNFSSHADAYALTLAT
jgi:hypothetical protein